MAKTVKNSKIGQILYFSPGSHTHTLLSVISVTGEYPLSSLYLLGSERYYKVLVNKLQEKHTVINSETGEVISTKLICVSGKGKNKTVRICKRAISILNWIGSDCYYRDAFCRYPFKGDVVHIERNHRVAEAVVMSMRAGFEYRPNKLSRLQNSGIKKVISGSPSFYSSRQIKSIDASETDKTMFTRIVGALFSSGECYAIYNTRLAIMKWNGKGELKTRYYLTDIARLNADINDVDTAILFGESYDVALRTVVESDKSHRHEYRFDDIYRHIHFIPLSEFGIKKFRLIGISNWKEKILSLLFEESNRSYNRGNFEYDAFVGGKYIFSFLDGDIARLIRFRRALEFGSVEKCEILCFPEEVLFVRELLGKSITIKTIPITKLEEILLHNER